MTKKQIRIDMEDSDGARYNIKLEGNVTRDKVLKIFEMMDLMNIEEEKEVTNIDSVNAKIWHIVDKFFPVGKFTSTNILEKYEDEYNKPIKLSVISTYLSRFSTKGRVNRTRTGREWIYQTIKIAQKQQQSIKK
jgi:predicted transcriptional regulator